MFKLRDIPIVRDVVRFREIKESLADEYAERLAKDPKLREARNKSNFSGTILAFIPTILLVTSILVAKALSESPVEESQDASPSAPLVVGTSKPEKSSEGEILPGIRNNNIFFYYIEQVLKELTDVEAKKFAEELKRFYLAKAFVPPDKPVSPPGFSMQTEMNLAVKKLVDSNPKYQWLGKHHISFYLPEGKTVVVPWMMRRRSEAKDENADILAASNFWVALADAREDLEDGEQDAGKDGNLTALFVHNQRGLGALLHQIAVVGPNIFKNSEMFLDPTVDDNERLLSFKNVVISLLKIDIEAGDLVEPLSQEAIEIAVYNFAKAVLISNSPAIKNLKPFAEKLVQHPEIIKF